MDVPDDRGEPSTGGDAPAHWFGDIASFLGPAYLRYSFTMGTAQEVEALSDILELRPGERLVDVGCGPGRHAVAMAAAGLDVTGVDISPDFVALATTWAEEAGVADRCRFVVGDARHLVGSALHAAGPYDAVISLCQGAFGLAGGPSAAAPRLAERELDEPILASMAALLRPGGRLAVSAFSAYFQIRYLEDGDVFDAEAGVNHEATILRDLEGLERPAELWTTCFTPRELRLLARLVGLRVEAVHGVTPGDYGSRPPSIDRPEFLLVATR
ncbi:MAG: SAM-dependent methyltransferase [Acidimicrobiales bacterium]